MDSFSPISLPETLRDMLARDRLPQALLLEGDDGAPLREAALTVAGATLCQRADGTMCGECPSCRKVLDLCHSDVIIVDSGADRDSFRKKNVRELRSTVYIKPVEGRAKFYIFLGAQELEPDTQSLLLKVIEEPPQDVCFILTVNNRSLLLPTILSRAAAVRIPAAQTHPLSGEPDKAEQKLREDAAALSETLLHGDIFASLAVLAQYEKQRNRYSALLDVLLADCRSPALHDALHSAAALCDANGYLPLVSSRLAGYARR